MVCCSEELKNNEFSELNEFFFRKSGSQSVGYQTIEI